MKPREDEAAEQAEDGVREADDLRRVLDDGAGRETFWALGTSALGIDNRLGPPTKETH